MNDLGGSKGGWEQERERGRKGGREDLPSMHHVEDLGMVAEHLFRVGREGGREGGRKRMREGRKECRTGV